MNLYLRQATADDAAGIAGLVQATFMQFVAPDWEPNAVKHFLGESSADRFALLIPKATYSVLAHVDNEIAGFILLPTPNLLAFLFVSGTHHGKGVARSLWQSACVHIETHHTDVKTIELNSSPYAVNAYRALGFYPISEPFRHGGCLATRMACWLPGRYLEQGLVRPNP